jgi:hypothetical protein
MDIELNTLKYMSRYTIGLPTEVPQTQNYTPHAKRIRKTTRNMLQNKSGYPDHVRAAFITYADAVVSFLESADQNARLQEEYEGMVTDQCPIPIGESRLDVVATTVQLLAVPADPELAVKQGLGIKTVKSDASLPRKRKSKK